MIKAGDHVIGTYYVLTAGNPGFTTAKVRGVVIEVDVEDMFFLVKPASGAYIWCESVEIDKRGALNDYFNV